MQRHLGNRCSICLKRLELTDEHIFPRGLTIPGTKQIRELLPNIDPNRKGGRGTRLSQNGLKLKTTCANCNNNLLGQVYDPALKELYDQASLFIRNRNLLFGRNIKLEKIKLNKVVRAVIGHMLASDTAPNSRAPKTREMRRLFFNHNHVVSSGYSVLMWLYPAKEQAVIRDIFVAKEFGANSENILWVSAYKTFPLAFAITHQPKKEPPPYKEIVDLTPHLTSKIDDQFNISLPIKNFPPFIWPEAPPEDGAILMGDGQRLLTKPYTPQKTYRH